MAAPLSHVRTVALPDNCGIAMLYASIDLADAYAVDLPETVSADVEVLARFMFSRPAPWVAALMKLRDLLVAGFGLKTGSALQALENGGQSSKRIGIFKIYAKSRDEIVLGEDDKHLDFRISVLRHATAPTVAGSPAHQLTVSTVVHCHNRLGRLYIALISPFHRLIVKAMLRRAARAGWTEQPAKT